MSDYSSSSSSSSRSTRSSSYSRRSSRSSRSSSSSSSEPSRRRRRRARRRSTSPNEPPTRRQRSASVDMHTEPPNGFASAPTRYEMPPVGRKPIITIPVPHLAKNDPQRQLIDLVADAVATAGTIAEEEIMAREKNNSHFAFMFAPWKHELQIYYRWKVWSLVQGDHPSRWRLQPFTVFEEELTDCVYQWQPPPHDPEHEEFTEKHRQQWFEILRNATPTRAHVLEALIFMMDNAVHATTVVEHLRESLENPHVSWDKLYGRLCILNDVVQNVFGGVPNVMKYQPAIDKAFAHMIPASYAAVVEMLPDAARQQGIAVFHELHKGLTVFVKDKHTKERLDQLSRLWKK